MLRQLLVIFTWTSLVLTISASAIIRNSDESYDMTPDEETGARVAQWNKEMNVNPEEMGSYIEGDIMLTRNTKRSGIIAEDLFWPNARIPYEIHGNFDASQRQLIRDAMKQYADNTCIRFVQRTDENDYVNIYSNDTGCWSNVGRIGGPQTVNLQIPGCVTLLGTVVHELMHSAGCWHEHTRDDRDKYVIINENNIQPKAKNNFIKDDSNSNDYYGVDYDYNSVMHYSRTAFAIDPDQDTITPTDSNASIGQRDGFSKENIKMLNNMYCN
ncbi:astacin-like metalloprotease toxin 5 [Monomorium pharaonis]|uniref:astacin-like metalloprotease toxin 5 n=1 Tax=Monomorium pharaonis TaxID=307658 RepID=UPI00063F369C|nr:astacin-like metalloprotease toxin 5 [Monomorium pharaonis]